MFPARVRLAVIGALLVGSGVRVGFTAVEPARTRAKPSRPDAVASAPADAPAPKPTAATKPPAVKKLLGSDYVAISDVADRLGLKLAWTKPGRSAVLSNAVHKVELDADGREVAVDGLRVFLGDPAVARGGELYVSRIDYERCLTPMLSPGLRIAPLPAPKIIVLDPGHGGIDNGAQNQNPKIGTKEKTAALDVALRLRKLLETAGYKVVLTRTTDKELAAEKQVDLAMRSEIANKAGADLFVSIHFNSLFPDTKTTGTEIFTFAPQFQRSIDSWGKGDDDAEAEAAPVNRFDHWSVVLAQALHRNLLGGLKTSDRGKKIKHLGVLRRLKCPAVLVESEFLSNDATARRVGTSEYRQQIADALLAGIRDYVRTLDSLRSKPSQKTATAPHPKTSNAR